ncbi:kynureninase [Neobacillus bataviensis LMG 21833]|uniref:Kynureninase n=1 Tax=Neobacillus bataviensis LMG 21833 TaxID=1117379 RepID=K6DVB0_9BACI|nr:kynureninase [Neobacillus bataviensis LMG 21833]
MSLEHSEAARICKSLKANGIIPDFRAPNIIRLAPVALYTSYVEYGRLFKF